MRDLARRRRRDAAAFRDRLDAADAFDAGVEADAFVDMVCVARAVGAGDRQRDDLIPESAGLRRRNGALMAGVGILVQFLFLDAVFLRHHLGADELAELDVGVLAFDAGAFVVAEAVLGGQRRGEPHRHPRHALDARGDHHVHGAGHHRLRGEVQRLLRGAALPVDRGAGHALGQLRGQHRVAGDIVGLLAGLHHAAHDDVVDARRIDLGPLDQRIEHRGGHVDRGPAGLSAAFAAAGGAGCGDDISLCHRGLPCQDACADGIKRARRELVNQSINS